MEWLDVLITFALAIPVIYVIFEVEIKEKLHMWFKTKEEKDGSITMTFTVDNEPEVKSEPEQPVDEWIWVEGYKATDKDMKCRDYQYTLGELHNMPNESDIKECESGFHLCKKLNDVFNYYEILDGHRFFKVRALVRKSHYERYGKYTEEYLKHQMDQRQSMFYNHFWGKRTYDKMVARSIIFERELTPDEILEAANYNVSDWEDEHKAHILQVGFDLAKRRRMHDKLIALGYSETFALHIIAVNKYDTAIAVGSQPDLSMDMKCWLIFK